MADKEETKGIIHWIWSNIDTLAIVGTVAAGFFSGRISEDADPKAKKAAQAIGMSTGGKDDPADEAFFKWAKSKVGLPTNRKTLQQILTWFTPYAFQLNHSEDWVRQRGRDSFEEWRRTICHMGQTEKQMAIDYLTAFATDIRDKYTKICNERGVKAWPFDDDNVEHRIARCEAFDYGIEQMRSEGTYVPTGAEATLKVRLKNLATLMGPKAFSAGKAAYDKAYNYIKENGPAYVDAAKAVSQDGWEVTTKKAKAADAQFARRAANLKANRESCLSWWGAYRKNRAEGLDRMSALLNAPRVARESRYGPWKQWTYRVAAAIMPFKAKRKT